MKLISLNIWGGKLYEPLVNFVKDYSKEVDIFCFQDVLFGKEPAFTKVDKGRINIFEELSVVLSDFNYVKNRIDNESHFHSEALDQNIGCGQVIFIRKPLEFKESGGFKTGDSNLWSGGNMVSAKHQWAKFKYEDASYVIMNVHGVWQANSFKKDTPERINQSNNIKDFFAKHDVSKILCGDLNVGANTETLKILEQDMVNLVELYNIKSTRSSYYTKEEKFADYVFVSRDITVNDFKVLPDEVSDHLALYLDFE